MSSDAAPNVELGRSQRDSTAFWLAIVVFGRLYTVLLCDVPDRLFGTDALCLTWIHGIPIHLWFELAVYGPLIWLALTRINGDVFSGPAPDEHELVQGRRRAFVGTAAAAMYLFGVGIHSMDLIEVARAEKGAYVDPDLFSATYFLDEGLSHYVQFVSLFFLLGWFVIFDRPRLGVRPSLAVFLGVAHGVERALGVIEGEKAYLGPVIIVWLAIAALVRGRRLGAAAAVEDFFFRYAVALVITLPLTQLLYWARFGAFTPESHLSRSSNTEVGIAAVLYTLVLWQLLRRIDLRRASFREPADRDP